MSTEILRPPFGAEARARISRALTEGAVMTYPTESSYALGGNALDGGLCARISKLKGRPGEKALLSLVEGEAMADALAEDIAPAVDAQSINELGGAVESHATYDAEVPASSTPAAATHAHQLSHEDEWSAEQYQSAASREPRQPTYRKRKDDSALIVGVILVIIMGIGLAVFLIALFNTGVLG